MLTFTLNLISTESHSNHKIHMFFDLTLYIYANLITRYHYFNERHPTKTIDDTINFGQKCLDDVVNAKYLL